MPFSFALAAIRWPISSAALWFAPCLSWPRTSFSTVEKEVRGQLKHGANRKAAELIGQRIAAKAKEKGIDKVAFDRAGYRYHGRVKALAEAARAGGLKF